MCDAPQSLASFFISLRKVKFFPKRHLADIPRVDCPPRYLVAVWGPIMPAGPALFRNTGHPTRDLRPTSGLQGEIDLGFGLIGAILADLLSHFCSCFIANAVMLELAVDAAGG